MNSTGFLSQTHIFNWSRDLTSFPNYLLASQMGVPEVKGRILLLIPEPSQNYFLEALQEVDFTPCAVGLEPASGRVRGIVEFVLHSQLSQSRPSSAHDDALPALLSPA